MEMSISSALAIMQAYDWNSSFTFVLLAIGMMFILRKWAMLLLTLGTVALGKLGADLILWNLANDQEIIRLPIVVYVVGGVIIGLVSVVSFTKYSID